MLTLLLGWRHAVEIHQEYVKSFPFVSRSSAYKFTIFNGSPKPIVSSASKARPAWKPSSNFHYFAKLLIKFPILQNSSSNFERREMSQLQFIFDGAYIDRKSPKPYPPSFGKLFMETFMGQQNDYEKSRNNSWIIGAHVECDLLRGWLLF